MSKDKISDYSSTANSNTDIAGINIDEGCAPSGINDAIRTLMAQLKNFQTGTGGDSFNGPVGSTTASTGAFTTLSASGTTTLSGGTANGVAYLNGSKVVTTGSNFAFDGNKLDVLRSSTSTTAFDEPEIRAINTGAATLNQRVDLAMRWQDGTYNGTGGISMIRESATARTGALTLCPIDSSGNAVTNMRLNSSGTVILQNGSTSATGVGITFPATQSASSDANTLDDYEEGTWTPVPTPNTGSFTTTTTVGIYVKVGRQVTVNGYINIADRGTATGITGFTGLPFTSNSSQLGGSGASREQANTGVLWSITVGQSATNTTMRDYSNGSAISNGVSWFFTLTYQAN